jgi:hypothetical protein
MSGDGWYNQFRPTTIMPSFSDINFTTSLLTLKNKPFFRQLFYTSQLLHITRGTKFGLSNTKPTVVFTLHEQDDIFQRNQCIIIIFI